MTKRLNETAEKILIEHDIVFIKQFGYVQNDRYEGFMQYYDQEFRGDIADEHIAMILLQHLWKDGWRTATQANTLYYDGEYIKPWPDAIDIINNSIIDTVLKYFERELHRYEIRNDNKH